MSQIVPTLERNMKRLIWTLTSAALVPGIAWAAGWNGEIERGVGFALCLVLTVFLAVWQWFAPWW
jgi:hypothetical protein